MLEKQTDYCCLRSALAKQDDPAYVKIALINDLYSFYRVGEEGWSRSPCSSPETLVRKYPAYGHTDCDECKHKFLCLVDREATVTFEKAMEN